MAAARLRAAQGSPRRPRRRRWRLRPEQEEGRQVPGLWVTPVFELRVARAALTMSRPYLPSHAPAWVPRVARGRRPRALSAGTPSAFFLVPQKPPSAICTQARGSRNLNHLPGRRRRRLRTNAWQPSARQQDPRARSARSSRTLLATARFAGNSSAASPRRASARPATPASSTSSSCGTSRGEKAAPAHASTALAAQASRAKKTKTMLPGRAASSGTRALLAAPVAPATVPSGTRPRDVAS